MKFWKFILIFSVVILAYWQTMFFFVWQDDHAVMFKLQHPSESAGQFGTEIYDRSSAYRGVIAFLLPIYNIFGQNVTAFYVFGIVAFSLAGVAVFFLAQALTNNKKIALLSSLIFASGYTGAESLWRIFNSIHTSHTIIALCLLLIFYKKFIKQKILFKKLLIYILTVFLFAYTLDTGFVRAHGIILAVLAVETLWNFNFFSIFRLTPFLLIFYNFYIKGYTATSEVNDLISNIFYGGQYELLLVPIKNLQNMFIPSLWQVPLWLFVFLLIIIFIKVKNKLLYFSLILMLGSYVVFFIHTPTQVFSSLHRYFLIPAIGASLFMAEVLVKTVPAKYIHLITGIIVVIHLFLINLEHKSFIEGRTIPAKNFYQVLKRELPVIPRGSLLLFRVKDDLATKEVFENAIFGVGSMPNSTAIAWQYGIDRYDFYLSFDQKNNIPVEKVYNFYYSLDSGLTKL